ncbi:MAG: ribbon-helix-helix protein, CopG family [Deferrisomatales bacterium]
MKTLSVKIPEALDTRLTEAARRGRATRSAVLREALEAFLAVDVDARCDSALSLVADLAGCLEGPPDLSADPRHLEGYGG